jgi:hypothetical protein
MTTDPLQWTDRRGVPHRLRLAHELSAHERTFLNLLRQQSVVSSFLLEAGYRTPTISQAPPNIVRTMVRILLPNVADEEIAAFDSTEGNDLLIQWWAVTVATLLSI